MTELRGNQFSSTLGFIVVIIVGLVIVVVVGRSLAVVVGINLIVVIAAVVGRSLTDS